LIRATDKNPQFTAKDLQDELMKGGKNICNAEYIAMHVGTSYRIALLNKKNIKG